MTEAGVITTQKLIELMNKTKYPIVQHNGQRKFGPPPGWTGSPPPKGCEVFIGKLPREIFEDELVPIFSKAGNIYEMRLMMDFSGSNRGYAFVTYTSREEAARAVKQLNNYEIRPGRFLGVVKSVDNCRLFVGNIPKNKTREDVLEELTNRVGGIVDVILYKNCFDKRLNRGFAFVEFISHRAAAMARRALVPGYVKLWDQDIMVDWAEPEPDVDEELINNVKILYARNFSIKTTPETIQNIFETACDNKIERVKKIYDYAFIHFFKREDAELALSKLHNTEIDGSTIELKWAKPVNRELYKIQKQSRGNAKFNTNLSLSQTLLLYKQQLDKREFVTSPKEDEGIGSVCAGESTCGSLDNKPYTFKPNQNFGPTKLESICKRYMWPLPVYDYHNYFDACGQMLWVYKVELQNISTPLSSVPICIGPVYSRAYYSADEARTEAADLLLSNIKILCSTPQTSASVPLVSAVPTVMPGCVTLPYDYFNTSLYYSSPTPTLPVNVPAMWRSV